MCYLISPLSAVSLFRTLVLYLWRASSLRTSITATDSQYFACWNLADWFTILGTLEILLWPVAIISVNYDVLLFTLSVLSGAILGRSYCCPFGARSAFDFQQAIANNVRDIENNQFPDPDVVEARKDFKSSWLLDDSMVIAWVDL